MLDAYRKLMDLLDARERRRFWLLMVLLVLMGLVNMLGVASVMPFLAVLSDPGIVERNAWLSWAYGLSGSETPLGFLLLLGVFAVIAYVGGLAFKAGATYALLRFAQMRHASLARKVFDGYLAQPYAWFLNRHSADLSKNVLNEVAQTVNTVLTPLLGALSNGVLVLFLVALLIVIDPVIALLSALVLGGGYALVFLGVRRALAELGGARARADRDRYQTAQEGLGGIKEVKVLGLEDGMSRRFADPALRVAEASAMNAVISQVPKHLLEALAFGGMMAVVLALAVLNDGALGSILPIAGVYALAGSRLAPALQEVYRALAEMRFGRPALEALHADVTSAPPAPLPPGPPLGLQSRLALDAVVYGYPAAERPALNGLSLEIPARASIGIVGGTGAGKTTAIDVLMGLLEPQQGALVVDGRPILTEEERSAWRRSIGYVPQQIFLADDSVAANIAFGLPKDEIDMKAVERAARMAELHRFVAEELPDGYDTYVGDRGVRLSGGQRQRIGIARALYRDPDVLVFDEATSALDNVTERAVMEAVNRLGGDKTVIMIAHRLTTVEGCDEIFVLENGQVSARGTYAELLERSDVFQRMVQGKAA
ncbi:MAG: ABC transporter ATP-binding protein [Pseudomonadota bacterium]